MFDTVNGLPLHPLVVHAVVVLLPLAAVGTIAIALVPRWRTTYGWLVLAAAAGGTALCLVATQSGEALQERVGRPEAHADLGAQLVWFSLPMVVLVAVLVMMQRGRVTATSRGSGSRGQSAVTVVAGLAVLAALASGFQVYRVGDSGARSVWGSVPEPR